MEGMDVLGEMAELARNGQACALATVVWRQPPSSSQPGARAIITAEGELRGWIGGACAEPAVIREAQRVIADGTARLLLLGTPEQFGAVGGSVPDGMTVIPISCQSEGALEVYIEPVLPMPHLVIVGGSPMARTLATMAGALGWRTDVVSGPDFATVGADERSMIVVATQGHDDEDVLEQAVAVRPAYLGLVGSRRRGATVLGYLADRGVPKDELDRVQVPAGLDLGKTTHQEIAVAILAELVRLRTSGALARGAARGRSTETGPQSQAAAEPGTTAVDPVCGMTVAATAARRSPSGGDSQGDPGGWSPPGKGHSRLPGLTLRHDGVDYYFCCAGCRQAFEQDPDTYTRRETRC